MYGEDPTVRTEMSSLIAERSALPASLSARTTQLEADFVLQFASQPDFLLRVPGRVNLIGNLCAPN